MAGSKKTGGGKGVDYKLEEQVGHVLRRAHQRASAIFLEEIGKSQLTPTQFAALVKLSDLGETSQNQLGRLTAMDPATIQGVIRRLKVRSLIAGRPDPADGRRTLLRLTAAGSALVKSAKPNGLVISREVLAPLKPAEQKRFLALLKRLT